MKTIERGCQPNFTLWASSVKSQWVRQIGQSPNDLLKKPDVLSLSLHVSAL